MRNHVEYVYVICRGNRLTVDTGDAISHVFFMLKYLLASYIKATAWLQFIFSFLWTLLQQVNRPYTYDEYVKLEHEYGKVKIGFSVYFRGLNDL